MSRLTIAVHNKAGLYVHRGSLVAIVPGGRRERAVVGRSAILIRSNYQVQGGFDPSKKSCVGVDFELLVRCLLLENKVEARKPSMIFR